MFRDAEDLIRDPFVGNVIPQSLVSPQAVKMASYFPVGPEPCGLTTYTLINNQTENMGLAKIDYQINSKQSLFGRYYVTHSLVPSSFTGSELSCRTPAPVDEVNSIVLGHTYIFGPNALNTSAYRESRRHHEIPGPILIPQSIGVNNIYEALPNYLGGHINITGNFNSAGSFATPGLVATTTYQVSDDFSLIRGSHQMQFGGTYIRPGQNSTFCVFCDGLFTFNGNLTGSAFGDFISGKLSQFQQLSITHDNERWNYFGLYAQDTWKATSHLTVNAGSAGSLICRPRFERLGNAPSARKTLDAGIHSKIYSNAPVGTLFPGDGAGIRAADRTTRAGWICAARRSGAWDPKGDGRTVIRASWGLFYGIAPHALLLQLLLLAAMGEGITITAPPGRLCRSVGRISGRESFPGAVHAEFPVSGGRLLRDRSSGCEGHLP